MCSGSSVRSSRPPAPMLKLEASPQVRQGYIGYKSHRGESFVYKRNIFVNNRECHLKAPITTERAIKKAPLNAAEGHPDGCSPMIYPRGRFGMKLRPEVRPRICRTFRLSSKY